MASAQGARPGHSERSGTGASQCAEGPRGSRSRRQCGAAGAARPHVLRARGSRSDRAGYPACSLAPAWGQGPAPRTSGGRGKNPKADSWTDLGPQREGGRRGPENRRIGKSREDAPRKCRELRERVNSHALSNPAHRESVIRPPRAPGLCLAQQGHAARGPGRPGKQGLRTQATPNLLSCSQKVPGQVRVGFSALEKAPSPSLRRDGSQRVLRRQVATEPKPDRTCRLPWEASNWAPCPQTRGAHQKDSSPLRWEGGRPGGVHR